MKKYTIPLLCLFSVLLHLLSVQHLEFHRDELLYFSLSNHLDLGYASVPPFIGFVAFLTKSIFGFSTFSVKLIPSLLSGLLVFLGSKITKELGGKYYAQVLTCVALIFTPAVLRAFILFQPVPFDIFFWTLIYYFILKYMNSQNDKYLYRLGGAIGIAILNKYLVLLLLLSLLMVLPFTKYRKLFVNKAFYLSLGITLLIVSPNIYWQISNNFPVFTHLAALQETQLQYVDKFGFLVDQVMMYLTSSIIAFIGSIYFFFYKKDKQLWLFSMSGILVIAMLLVLQGKPYYAAGIYPFLICGGCVFIENKLKKGWARILVILFIIGLMIPMIPNGIPIMSPEKLAGYFDKLDAAGVDVGRIHEDGHKHSLPQDYADMMGWHEIANFAKIAYDKVEDKSSVAVFGENYGIAGAVSLLNKKYGMPEAISFSDTYAFWAPESFEPDIQSLIYINDELGEDVNELFTDIIEIGRVTDVNARQLGVTVYLCRNPKSSFSVFWKNILDYVREERGLTNVK